MGINDRKGRDRAERRQRIVAAARAVAERDGWAAVTIRRLADEIEHSQPVLYSHFGNRTAIVAAVAIEGFREFASAIRGASREATDRRARLEAATAAYLDFARGHPAVYEAMFTLPTDLRFARSDTEPELRDAFGALSAAMGPTRTDRDTATETFWAILHGLVALERSGRIRPGARDERVALVVGMLLAL